MACACLVLARGQALVPQHCYVHWCLGACWWAVWRPSTSGQRLSIACLHQVHTNIVIFNLHDACPLTAKDFIPLLQQHGVLVIPFRCTTCTFL